MLVRGICELLLLAQVYTLLKLCSLFSGNLGEPVLLPVWFPVSSVYHLNHISITNLYCHGVFSTVWGGKCHFTILTQLHSEWPKLHWVLAILRAVGYITSISQISNVIVHFHVMGGMYCQHIWCSSENVYASLVSGSALKEKFILSEANFKTHFFRGCMLWKPSRKSQKLSLVVKTLE